MWIFVGTPMRESLSCILFNVLLSRTSFQRLLTPFFGRGITSAQSDTASTLLMCLREIERCTIFIGIYGERYEFVHFLIQMSHLFGISFNIGFFTNVRTFPCTDMVGQYQTKEIQVATNFY
jgi:hypothetical protein